MDPNNFSELSYEQAIAELESIINKLENGQVGLEESLELYRTGTLLAKICGDKLAEAERQIVIITQTAEGKTVEKEFIPESEDGQGVS